MTAWLIALGVAAAPLLPLAFSHPAGLERVRDWWLRGVALGAILLAPPALAPIAAWFSWRWPQGATPWRWVPALVVWVSIGLTWALLERLPPAAWPWISAGWASWGLVQVGVMAWRATKQGGRGWVTRQPGWNFGTPVMVGMYLALTAPFWPVWTYPVLAVGLWLTSSWAAWLAVGAGALVYLVPWRG